jgi:hypothetical protein
MSTVWDLTVPLRLGNSVDPAIKDFFVNTSAPILEKKITSTSEAIDSSAVTGFQWLASLAGRPLG